MAPDLQLTALSGLPEIHPGDDLPQLLLAALPQNHQQLQDDDVLVVAQKIISKSEGALLDLDSVTPSEQARAIAASGDKDARTVEVVLSQSRRIVRQDRVLITETKHGFICANAGIDHSNVPGEKMVTLLPADPDGSAERLRHALEQLCGVKLGVIITDTFGRPWRLGVTNVAIGAAGVAVLHDYRNRSDDHGKLLTTTVIAVADELAAAAGLLMGKTNRCPVVLVRGWKSPAAEGRAADLIRPPEQDLFR